MCGSPHAWFPEDAPRRRHGSCPALSALRQPKPAARDAGRVAFTRLRDWRAHWQRDGGEIGAGLVVTGAGAEGSCRTRRGFGSVAASVARLAELAAAIEAGRAVTADEPQATWSTPGPQPAPDAPASPMGVPGGRPLPDEDFIARCTTGVLPGTAMDRRGPDAAVWTASATGNGAGPVQGVATTASGMREKSRALERSGLVAFYCEMLSGFVQLYLNRHS